jgi:hypothetical protein
MSQSNADDFVLSLLQSESEEALQVAVTQVFREYGPVFVKIRRDAKQMPFAFCQYTVSPYSLCSTKACAEQSPGTRACRARYQEW